MPRVGLDPETVVAVAAKLADANGLEQLTLARLSEQLGVRTPSLYAHIGGLADLRRRLASRGARELGALLADAAAGRSAADALRAIATAYRGYAREHPGTYAALQRASSFSEEGPAAERVVEIVVAVLRGYGLEGEDAIHAVRIVRAALHGFVSLEATGGFGRPLDLNESFARLVTALDRGLGP